MTRLAIAIASIIALSACAHAQEAPKGDLQVRFLAERTPEEIGQVLLAAEKYKGVPFDLPINYLSPPQAPPGKSFSVWSVAKNVSLATVTLPEKGKSFIVLLIPSAKAGYDPVVIASDDPSFKPGDVYFYNHADRTVLGYVGTSKFTIAPDKGQMLRPAGLKEGKYYDVGFGVREKEGDRVLSTSRWPEDNKMRSYMFFFINPRTQRLDFRAVDEFVPPGSPQKP